MQNYFFFFILQHFRKETFQIFNSLAKVEVTL